MIFQIKKKEYKEKNIEVGMLDSACITKLQTILLKENYFMK